MKSQNYYDVLQLDTGCSASDIKRNFRRLAKEIHPDVYHDHQDGVERMHILLQAYETLVHPDRRRQYDLTHSITPKKYSFNYREYLCAEPENPAACSKLVFYDLLNGYVEEALETYNRSMRNPDYRLADWLDREDFMDCAFLLSEALEETGNYYRAFTVLMDTVDMEKSKPYFRHFFVEVSDRLRRLISIKMPGFVSQNTYIQCLEQLIEADLNPRDSAFYLKRAAELYCECGENERATEALQRAFKLDPKLTGTKKLLSKLILEPEVVQN